MGKKKLRYIPPLLSDGKLVVHLDYRKFHNVQKKYENILIKGIRGEKITLPICKGVSKECMEVKEWLHDETTRGEYVFI